MRYFVLSLLFVPQFVVAAGGLTLTPVYSTHSIGETFEMRVLADTGGEPVSAAEAEIRFDAGALVVEDISLKDSIIATFSTGPDFSNEEGVIRFAGWTSQPFTGSEGVLVTITFKPLRNMASDVRFASGALLASDSRGSNVLERMGSALIIVGPREVTVARPENAGEIASGASTGIDSGQPAPPAFEDFDRELQIGERIIIRGTAAPNGLVTVYVTKDETVTESSVVSASDGSFTYVSADETEEGIYRISADVETADGVRSERADRVVITVRPAGLSEVAAASLPFSEDTLPLFGLGAILVLCAAFSAFVVRRIYARKHRASAEA